jgi:hypothetical protein
VDFNTLYYFWVFLIVVLKLHRGNQTLNFLLKRFFNILILDMAHNALDSLREAIDTLIDGIEQNSFDDYLGTAELAEQFLTNAIDELPENAEERNVFNHHFQNFVLDNPLPGFEDNLDNNIDIILEYLDNLQTYFNNIDYIPPGTLEDTSNKRRRDDEDEDEAQTPPASKEARTSVGLGRYLRFGGANYF